MSIPRTSFRRVVLVIAMSCVACAVESCAAQQPGASDAALATAVGRFFEEWIVKGDAGAAVQLFISPVLDDERLLPTDVSAPVPSSQERTREFAETAHPASALVVRDRFTRYLDVIGGDLLRTTSLEATLLPVSLESIRIADERLAVILEGHNARPLPGIAALAYPVGGWKDVQWLASETVGYRVLLAQLIDQTPMRAAAVLTKVPLNTGGNETAFIVTLWGQRNNSPEWRLLGVDVAPMD